MSTQLYLDSLKDIHTADLQSQETKHRLEIERLEAKHITELAGFKHNFKMI